MNLSKHLRDEYLKLILNVFEAIHHIFLTNILISTDNESMFLT